MRGRGPAIAATDRRARFARASHAASWSATSQAAYAGSNIAVELSVAVFVGLVGLGEWALRYAVLVTAIYLTRAVVGDLLLADRAPAPAGERDRRTADLGALVLILGAVQAIVLAGVAALTGDISWLIVGLAIPGALVQDLLRYVAFWKLEPRTAAVLDMVWTACSIVGVAVIAQSRSVTTAVAVWGIGALISAVVGVVWTRMPFGSAVRGARWWWSHRRLAFPTLLDTGLYLVGNQGLWVLLGARAGTAELGAFRLALLAANPALLVLLAAQTLLVPVLARRSAASQHLLMRLGLLVPVVGAMVFALTVALVIPLLKHWDVAQGDLTVALGGAALVYVMLMGVYVVIASSLRARRAGTSFLSMRSASTFVSLGLCLLAGQALTAGAVMLSMAAGLAAAVVVGAVLSRRADAITPERTPSPEDGDPRR